MGESGLQLNIFRMLQGAMSGLQVPECAVYCSNCTACIMQCVACPFQDTNYAVCNMQCCAVFIVQCSVQFLVFSVQCDVFSAVYSVQCAVCCWH